MTEVKIPKGESSEIKEAINREESKFVKKRKQLFQKIQKAQNEKNISIYIGAGLYQITEGLLITLLVSISLGLPIIVAYPYISPILL